jgi:hypothetical protein
VLWEFYDGLFERLMGHGYGQEMENWRGLSMFL